MMKDAQTQNDRKIIELVSFGAVVYSVAAAVLSFFTLSPDDPAYNAGLAIGFAWNSVALGVSFGWLVSILEIKEEEISISVFCLVVLIGLLFLVSIPESIGIVMFVVLIPSVIFAPISCYLTIKSWRTVIIERI